MTTPIVYQKLVDYFGGNQSATARALGVEQPSVRQWIQGTNKMGAETAFKAEAATKGKFKAYELCTALKHLKPTSQTANTD